MAWLIGESSLWSMKVSDPGGFIDLAVRRFKHGGDLGDLRCLREPGKLIGGHGQVGAWGFVDVVAENTDKFIVEVVLEWSWPSLRVELIIASSLG